MLEFENVGWLLVQYIILIVFSATFTVLISICVLRYFGRMNNYLFEARNKLENIVK